MIGTTFSNWTVVGGPDRRSKPQGGSRTFWLCRCDCGIERLVDQAHLRSGRSSGCGCDRPVRVVHGHNRNGRRSPELSSYRAMKDRCTQPSHIAWDRYGGAGVTVCYRWMDSFEAFLADMGPKPTPRHSIDRIDNAKGYEPGNCRWATTREQRLNSSGGFKKKGTTERGFGQP